MNSEDIAVVGSIFAVVGGAVAIVSVLVTRNKAERLKRLEVMSKAMENPSIDEPTRRQLLDTLAEDQRQSSAQWSMTLDKLRRLGRMILVAGGWILFCIGGGMLLLDTIDVVDHIWMPGVWMTFLIGFVAMTLPVATRELMARSDPAPVGE
ncbi:MAG: hypothetical protein NXI31_13680 [bacterium]|nr:hypothetical protein [bacterium]